jgi:predicted PhzF superfamily epimerase YddE/YHI9
LFSLPLRAWRITAEDLYAEARLPFAGHPTLGECRTGIINLSVEQTRGGSRISFEAPKANITELTEDQSRVLTSALRNCHVPSHPPLPVDVGVVWLIADLADSRSVVLRCDPTWMKSSE